MLGLGVNITKPSCVVSDTTWANPLSFGSDLILWYRKGATNFIKVGGGTPAAGDEIQQWTDLSGNGNNALGTVGYYPKLDDGGDESLWLNNAIDYLNFTTITFSGEFAIYMKLEVTDVLNVDIILSDSATSDEFFRLKTDKIRGKLDGAAMDWDPPVAYDPLAVDTFYQLGIERGGETFASDLVNIFIEGLNTSIYDTSSAYGTTANNSSSFTLNEIGGGNFTGRIKEMFIVDRGLTVPERVAVDNYLTSV